MTPEPAVETLSTEKLLDRRLAIEAQIKSVEGYLATALKSYKHFRQSRGIDSVRRAEHFGAQVKRQEAKLAELRGQLRDTQTELDRRQIVQ